ncbi:MAG TPA: ketoacyl-ACP synthase III [Aliidongia sp.]|nr:ketoacyl-ACP synthase III [Aliidongia sp.]
MRARIAAIAYHLPEAVLDNTELARRHPRFQPDKLKAKTGIDRRHIAAAGETAADLAVHAAERLFTETGAERAYVDYLIFCTQAPDYMLPTSACLIHQRLGLRAGAGALDINLGCSGFVYGLGLAQGLIQSGQAARVLLLTADTYSKFIDVDDLGVRSIFGDGAAATLIAAEPERDTGLGPFVYGTDGKGAEHLIVPTGGQREPTADASYEIGTGEIRPGRPLHMNGPEVFNFTLGAVPALVQETLAKAGLGMDEIDLFVFHQANSTMLEALRRKLAIPGEKFFVDLDGGNTVSSTIPIALHRAVEVGMLRTGMRVMLVGFGVGYSWAATILVWG